MDNRNLILAIALSAVIIIAFQFLVPPPKHPVVPPVATSATEQDGTTASSPAATGAGGDLAAGRAPAVSQDRDEIIAKQKRILIDTPRLKGSIDLQGAIIDDLTLSDYHATVDPTSPAIVLLSPSGAPQAYIAEQGWVPMAAETRVPGAETEWQSDGTKLGIGTPVTLTWDNGAGLGFSRVISIDENYMFTVKQTVTNGGAAPVGLKPFALVARSGVPPSTGIWISYEGPIGAFNGVEQDVKYGSILEGKPIEQSSTGGWLGFSDKYWLASIAPADQAEPIIAGFRHTGSGIAQKYQTDYLGPEMSVAPGATISTATLVFAGPKEVKLLAHYRDALGLPRFDNAVDFGWFWFFTKPIFYLLDYIYAAVGNFGIAILVLTVLIKALFFPLQTRAVISMNKMKALQPELAKLREKFKDDTARLNQEMMALQKRMGANPLAGCLPVLMQVPVFFSLYKVLYVTIEMRHAPFYGWIHDLSAPDPTSIWNLFGAIPWAPPHFLPVIGVWPVIYCATMMLQQRMQPVAADPVQAKMLQFMPLFFTFMLGNFPAGLVMYWSWNNTLTMIQQYVITRHMIAAKPAKV